jgi:hypothetical protein
MVASLEEGGDLLIAYLDSGFEGVNKDSVDPNFRVWGSRAQ